MEGRRALASGAVIVIAVLVGTVSALADEDRSVTLTRRPCSDHGGDSVTYELEVEDRSTGPAGVQLTATAEVSATAWEVGAALADPPGTGDWLSVSRCFLGLDAVPPSLSIAVGGDRAVVRATRRTTWQEEGCFGPFALALRGGRAVVAFDERPAELVPVEDPSLRRVVDPSVESPRSCKAESVTRADEVESGPLGKSGASVAVIVEAPGRWIAASPRADHARRDRVQWTRAAGASVRSLRAEVGLSVLSAAASHVEATELELLDRGSDRVVTRPGLLGSWLVELGLVAAVAIAARCRRATAIAAVTALLVLAATTRYQGEGLFLTSRLREVAAADQSIVGIVLAVSGVLVGRSLVTRAGSALCIVPALFTAWWGGEEPSLLGPTALAIALSGSIVLWSLFSSLRQVLPGHRDVVPWSAVDSAIGGLALTVVAFTGARALVASLTESFGGLFIDVRTFAYSAIAFSLIATVCVAVDSAHRPSLMVSTRRQVALVSIVWAVLAADGQLHLVTLSLPVATAVSGVVLYLLARPLPAIGPGSSAGPVRSLVLGAGGTSPPFPVDAAAWRTHAFEAVELGALVALVPVGYFAVTAMIGLPTQDLYGAGLAFFVVGGLIEVGRWMATAWAFGALYARLPGRTGVIKAGALVGAWVLGAGAAEVGNLWAGEGSGREWLFPGLQLVLFLAVLGVVFDRVQLAKEGKGWPEVVELYGMDHVRTAIGYVGPVVLAVLAIAQQLASGTGTEFVSSVIDGLSAI